MLYKIAPALDTAVYRYAESEEEVRWLTAAKKMAFGVACRAILGDKFTEEDHEYMFPLYSTISNGLVSLVRFRFCLLYTSPSPRDATLSRMPSSA